MWPPDDEDFWTAPKRGEAPYRTRKEREPEEPSEEETNGDRGSEEN